MKDNEPFLVKQDERDSLILKLDESGNAIETERQLAPALFATGLTVYSQKYCLDSLFYSSFTKSKLDSRFSLHPEEISILRTIEDHDASIISAPTSLGKTFCVFEYIVRHHPKNVVLIVPTLALGKEYLLNIVNQHKEVFQYKVFTTIDDNDDNVYDFEKDDNLFILTHDRIVANQNWSKITKIDFLVIDEVYKLDTSMSDDRTLVLNLAYQILAKKAEKYVLLAPFISGVSNCERLEKKPYFYSTDYQPVYNKVETIRVARDKDRLPETDRILSLLGSEKTLVYFPSPSRVNTYLRDVVMKKGVIEDLPSDVQEFIDWARAEIHPDWIVANAIERGYLAHYGPLPPGVRDYLLHLFNGGSELFPYLLCTSTLLEGVNTTAENLVIVDPSKGGRGGATLQRFSAFDFYNLVGRTGRLGKYFVGNTYCLALPEDKPFDKKDAMVTISFLATQDNVDQDLFFENFDSHPEEKKYLEDLGFKPEAYAKEVGAIEFCKFKQINEQFQGRHDELIASFSSKRTGKILKELIPIISISSRDKENATLAGWIMEKSHYSVFRLFQDIRSLGYFSLWSDQFLLDKIIKIKNGYLEYTLLERANLVKTIMEKANESGAVISSMQEYVIRPLEEMYFIDSPQKRMMRSVGIYERDMDAIINMIGDDFTSITELAKRLANDLGPLYNTLSFISRYEIGALIRREKQ